MRALALIPTRVHGVLDYVVSLVVLASPWALNFAAGGAETWVPVVLGLGSTGYSLFTDYEWGLVRRIPMRVHLMLDFGSGAVLALSPWLFGFADRVWGPHLALGLVELGVTMLSQSVPGARRLTAPRAA